MASGAPNRSSGSTARARLHNFVKYALLQQLVPPGATVCDLYCGRGLDIEKWMHAQIGHYIGIDFAASTLEEAKEQWNNWNRPYTADFYQADPSTANLEYDLRHAGLPADFVTCMGHLQDCFSEEDMVRSLLHNVASILKPGGYFFGITADSSTIWSKYQKVVESAHRAGSLPVLPRVNSEHYVISFEDDRFTPFGTRYTLQFADGVISECQQLIHFPSLIRLAEEVGLEYIELQNLQEFYDDYRIPFSDILRATCSNLVDPKGKLPQFAHDILSLYTTFIFRKADPCDYYDMVYSPWTVTAEEQLEVYPEDLCADVKMAPYADGCDEYKSYAPIPAGYVDGNSYYPHPAEVSKDTGQTLQTSYSQKPLEKKDKPITELETVKNVEKIEERVIIDPNNESDASMEMELSDSPGPGADEGPHQQSTEVGQNVEVEPQVDMSLNADVKNMPAGEDASKSPKAEVGAAQPSDLSKADIGETKKDIKDESVLEEQGSQSTHTQKNDHVSGGNDSYKKPSSLSSPPISTTSIEPDKKRNDLQSSLNEENKNEGNSKDSRHSKELIGKEESSSSSAKRPFTGSQPASADQQRHRGNQGSTKANHSNAQKEEFSQVPRHKSNMSNSKVSRERAGDHIAVNQSHRNRPRILPPAPPSFVPLIHFVPPPEFPVFQSPNTPGLLGPGPAALRLPDPITFWTIQPQPPIERRIQPKNRASRKHSNNNERETNRTRKESPKKSNKDSPPPGTES